MRHRQHGMTLAVKVALNSNTTNQPKKVLYATSLSCKNRDVTKLKAILQFRAAFIDDKATMSSIRYFENHVSYFVQNRRK